MGVGRNIPYKSLRPIVDDTTSRWETYKLSLPKWTWNQPNLIKQVQLRIIVKVETLGLKSWICRHAFGNVNYHSLIV